MEQPTYPGGPSEAPQKQKMSPWVIVLIILVGIPVVCVLASLCVIVILALLGPAISNVFSNIVLNV